METVIAALIGAIASISAALIANRATKVSQLKETSTEKVRKDAPTTNLRPLAWSLVGIVYLIALYCLGTGGIFLSDAYRSLHIQATPTTMALAYYYDLSHGIIYLIGGLILILIGYLSQRRLMGPS